MTITKDNVLQVMQMIQKDPSCSYWLRDALKASMQRDPVDATNDIELLHTIMKAYCERLFEGGTK